ncbi:MAG: UxaA family hydrolase [Planctomycetota bacterium]
MPDSFFLNEVGVMVQPALDNVVISKTELKPQATILFDGDNIVISDCISRGQRFAVRDIPNGEPVIQYGSPFGASTGIGKGQLVHSGNIREISNKYMADVPSAVAETVFLDKYVSRKFKGYKRENKAVGTRNYYLIMPTSLCASQVAAQVALQAQQEYNVEQDFPHVDDIIAIPHTEGCGCASNMQIDRLLKILKNYMTHPNVGAALVIDLGCEQTNYSKLFSYLKSRQTYLTVPVDWLTIQKEGGSRRTIQKSLDIIGERLPEVNENAREDVPIEQLVIATECGASDAYSGITANAVIGRAVDKVIYGKGSAILSEFPEMVGAEYALIRRMRSRDVASKFEEMMQWYRNLAEKLNVAMSDNLVPENIAGGLINPCIKSLGAIVKGGTTAIEDVLDYADKLAKRGLNLMQGPGNDMESVTGMVAAGANVVCFSTGKGAITGNPIVPVIKISSTSDLAQRMPDDIDFDAGTLLEYQNGPSLDELSESLLAQIVAVASGRQTRSEINRQHEFQVWTAGKLSL